MKFFYLLIIAIFINCQYSKADLVLDLLNTLRRSVDTKERTKQTHIFKEKQDTVLHRGEEAKEYKKRSLLAQLKYLIKDALNDVDTDKHDSSDRSALSWKRSDKLNNRLIPALPWKRTESDTNAGQGPALPWKRWDKTSNSNVDVGPAIPWKRSYTSSNSDANSGPTLPWKRSDKAKRYNGIPALPWKRSDERQMKGLAWDKSEKTKQLLPRKQALYKRLLDDLNTLFTLSDYQNRETYADTDDKLSKELSEFETQ